MRTSMTRAVLTTLGLLALSGGSATSAPNAATKVNKGKKK